MKTCTKCKVEKEVLSFSKNKNRKDGFESQCKSCVKEYQLLNKDKIKSWSKQYNIDNKEQRKIYLDQYYIQNIEKIKDYYVQNKEHRNRYEKEKYIENKEKRKEYKKQYNLNNIESRRIYNKKYNKNKPQTSKDKDLKWKRDRYKTDPLFKLTTLIRNNIYQSIKIKGYYKNKDTQNILCCSFKEFKLYIESKFESWMNWDNYGLYNGELNYGWDIDHIIPVSSAKTEEEVLILNHFSNLQPLCSKVNRDIKRDLMNYKGI